MVNNDDRPAAGRGSDHVEPGHGAPFIVTIPFLGVRACRRRRRRRRPAPRRQRPGCDGDARRRSRTRTSRASRASRRAARASGDSGLKPNITAPGVAIVSTGVGTGNGRRRSPAPRWPRRTWRAWRRSTRQAHPTWSVEDIKAAIVNTGDPSQVAGPGLPDQPRRHRARRSRRSRRRRRWSPRRSGDEFAISRQLRLRGAEGTTSRRRETISCTTTARRRRRSTSRRRTRPARRTRSACSATIALTRPGRRGAELSR